MLNIPQITVQDIRRDFYTSELPEIYALRPVIENGPWHIQQSVFDHTLAVYESYCADVLSLGFVDLGIKAKIQEHLSEVVGSKNRSELGRIATLYHDIGKLHTNTVLESGDTINPFHDFVGAGMFMKADNVFNLLDVEKNWIRNFILYHSYVYQIVSFTLNGGEEKKFLRLFGDVVGDMVVDLLLFLLADLRGSDLMKTSPERYVEIERGIVRFMLPPL